MQNIKYFGYTKEEIIKLYLKSVNYKLKLIKINNVLEFDSITEYLKYKYLKRIK